jgi:alpha-glucosidase
VTWLLRSPSGRVAVDVRLDDTGRLSYRVLRGDADVVAPSRLGVARLDTTFDDGLDLVDAGAVEVIDERYTLRHGKRLEQHARANARTLLLRNPDGAPLAVDLRAYDDGAAFRYRFPDAVAEPLTVTHELTTVTPASSSMQPGRVWAQPTQEPAVYGPAYENPYADGVPTGTPSTGAAWDLPALFETGDAWLLVTEAGLDASFYGSRLGGQPDGASYRFVPPQAGEGDGVGETSATSSSPWILPWRVLVITRSAGDAAASALVTHLAAPNRLADDDWVRPGRVSWSWWSENTSPRDLARLREYVDLAAEFGWEYSLVDANWNVHDDEQMRELVRYAAQRGVRLWLWYNSGGRHNHVPEQPRDRMADRDIRRAEFARLAEWGVAGVKVDFFHSDKQDGIARYLAILEDAAEYQIMVNFHGCTIPRGWSRTWPHLLTMEGVRGAETYIFDPAFPPQAPTHNTILPFTRNAVGPMDYTPVTFGDVAHPHLTTNAHELALAVVFESGLLHLADSAGSYRSVRPEVAEELRLVPVAWDETRFLVAEPGRCVVVARRRGDGWWVAGINGVGEPRAVEIELGELTGDHHAWRVLSDGDRRDAFAVRDLPPGTSRLALDLAPRGGFFARSRSS